jgi:hypothetical protein
VLEVLDRFKRLAGGFAAREDRIQAGFAAKANSAAKAHEYASAQLSARVAESIANLDAEFQSKRNQCDGRFERLKARIHHAHRSSARVELEKIELKEGRLKYETQKSMLEADRRRDASLAVAGAEFKQLQENLNASEEAFQSMEAAARKAFRGYGKFRWMMARDMQSPESGLSAGEVASPEALEKILVLLRQDMERFVRLLLPRIFARLSVWLLAVLSTATAVQRIVHVYRTSS